jgi:hypothetical protein
MKLQASGSLKQVYIAFGCIDVQSPAKYAQGGTDGSDGLDGLQH